MGTWEQKIGSGHIAVSMGKATLSLSKGWVEGSGQAVEGKRHGMTGGCVGRTPALRQPGAAWLPDLPAGSCFPLTTHPPILPSFLQVHDKHVLILFPGVVQCQTAPLCIIPYESRTFCHGAVHFTLVVFPPCFIPNQLNYPSLHVLAFTL